MKTIEEENNEYVRRKFGFATADQVKDTFNVFKAGVEFAQRWIPVEEISNLTTGEKYLIKFNVAETKTQNAEFGIIDTGFFLEDGLWDIEQQCGLSVTHYRKIEIK